MDDAEDFKRKKIYYDGGEFNATLYHVGDLVRFVGYHYSPDYIYIDGDDYQLGVIVEIIKRQFYPQPIYRIFWFTKGHTTDAVEDHLRLVVINKTD